RGLAAEVLGRHAGEPACYRGHRRCSRDTRGRRGLAAGTQTPGAPSPWGLTGGNGCGLRYWPAIPCAVTASNPRPTLTTTTATRATTTRPTWARAAIAAIPGRR